MIQSRTITKRRPSPDGKYAYLKSSEIMYLRLYLHDLSDDTIRKFMDTNPKSIRAIRIQLEKKFKTSDWRIIVALAIDKGYLNIVDFADKDVKLDALQFTEKLYEHYIIGNMQKAYAEEDLIAFYKKNKQRTQAVYNSSSENQQLTKSEIQFIASQFKGKEVLNESDHDQDLKATFEAKTIKLILKKLQVNNWFNLYRKAHLLDLIDHSVSLKLQRISTKYIYSNQKSRKIQDKSGPKFNSSIHDSVKAGVQI